MSVDHERWRSAPARSSLRGEAPAHAPGLARGVRGMWGVLRGNRATPDAEPQPAGARRQHNLLLKNLTPTLSHPARIVGGASAQIASTAPRTGKPSTRSSATSASDFTRALCAVDEDTSSAPRETREACAASVVDQKILCVLDSQNASGKSQKPRLDQSSPGSGRRPARDRRPSEFSRNRAAICK